MIRKCIYAVITVPIVMLLFSGLPGCRNKTVQEGRVAAPDKKAFLESRFEAFAERYDLASGSPNNQSFLKATENLHIGLQEAGIGHAYQAVNDGHEWANWRERTDEVLEYFWK